MSVVICRACGTSVLPREDGTCPRCKQSTEGSRAAPELSDEVIARARAWDEYRHEKAADEGLMAAGVVLAARGNLERRGSRR